MSDIRSSIRSDDTHSRAEDNQERTDTEELRQDDVVDEYRRDKYQ